MTFILFSVRVVYGALCFLMVVPEKGSKRAEIKELIHELAQKDPVIEYNIFRSVENVNLNTVIGYKQDGVRHNFLDTYDDVK